jgi:hypothetical protein
MPVIWQLGKFLRILRVFWKFSSFISKPNREGDSVPMMKLQRIPTCIVCCQIALAAASRYDIKPNLSARNLPLSVFHAPDSKPRQGIFNIVGSTCMENDCLYDNYTGKLGVNDHIVFNNVGAYTNVLRPPFINFAPHHINRCSRKN